MRKKSADNERFTFELLPRLFSKNKEAKKALTKITIDFGDGKDK